MKLLWRQQVYGWWSVTGLIGKRANWFFGFSRKPPSPAQPLPPLTDPRTAWVMPSAPELFKFINSTPLLQSLLYDLNLLPECISDSTSWTYMLTVCDHWKAANVSAAKEQQ